MNRLGSHVKSNTTLSAFSLATISEGLNLPARVRVVLAHTSPEEALAAVAARRSIVLSGRSVAANRANIAAAIAIRHADHLQVFNVVHHRG